MAKYNVNIEVIYWMKKINNKTIKLKNILYIKKKNAS